MAAKKNKLTNENKTQKVTLLYTKTKKVFTVKVQ